MSPGHIFLRTHYPTTPELLNCTRELNKILRMDSYHNVTICPDSYETRLCDVNVLIKLPCNFVNSHLQNICSSAELCTCVAVVNIMEFSLLPPACMPNIGLARTRKGKSFGVALSC